MTYGKANIIYFSATGTTAKISKAVVAGAGIENNQVYNITNGLEQKVVIPRDEVAVFGMPVYSGRIPQIAIDSLRKFSGNCTPAIVICAYGNRAFDDALVELQDTVQGCGFNVVSAGAFIARHSIFPRVAQDRPDKQDMDAAVAFGRKSIEILNHTDELTGLKVQGNHSYRAISPIPLQPRTNRHKCNLCGVCTKQCPAKAIDAANPRKIDKSRCMSCARCITVCPQEAKHFGGILYKLASKKFDKMCSERKVPYTVYAELR